MKCHGTIRIRNPNKRKGGFIDVPCGKCAACLSNKRTEWSIRLQEELKIADSAHFITLTYDDENLPPDGNLHKKDLQKFFKRLRKNEKEKKIRYYAVGEYGTINNRPHYHIILFNLVSDVDISAISDSDGIGMIHSKMHNQKHRIDVQSIIEKAWKNGIVHVGTVTRASISYCTSYVIQKFVDMEKTKPFALMSKRPAIGANYVSEHEKSKPYYQDGANKKSLPRFYKNKIYSEFEKKKIAEALEKFHVEHDKEAFEHNAKYYDSPFIGEVDRKKAYDYKQSLNSKQKTL